MEKGSKMTLEQRQKIKDTLRIRNPDGRQPWNKGKTLESYKTHYKNGFGGTFKKGDKAWHSGKTGVYSEDAKEKMRKAKLGKPSWNKGTKGVMKSWNKGTKGKWKLTEEQRRKKSENARRGERHHSWKGGVKAEHLRIRHSLEYKLWREAIFKRDNYTCIWCGDSRGGNLNADHIKPFALYPELRFALDNGRTLCITCHKTTETYGNRKR
jgi:5-methylcytosine-specific restriction endonuclease McrA